MASGLTRGDLYINLNNLKSIHKEFLETLSYLENVSTLSSRQTMFNYRSYSEW